MTSAIGMQRAIQQAHESHSPRHAILEVLSLIFLRTRMITWMAHYRYIPKFNRHADLDRGRGRQ